MRVGVFVGSFDPVHNGHMEVANYLLNHDYLDKVLVIPTMPYWDKDDLAPLIDRINMLKFYETDKIVIDTEHNYLPYTYIIMDSLKRDNPNDSFRLIIGADNIIEFHKWRNYQRLLDNGVIVLNRDNININEYIEKYPDKEKFIVVNDFPFVEVSSTEIREGSSDKLNPLVAQYILEHNLYKKKSK